MRLSYQIADDEVWRSVRVKSDDSGNMALGPRQMKKLIEAEAWRFRAGSPNGPDVFVDLETGEVA